MKICTSTFGRSMWICGQQSTGLAFTSTLRWRAPLYSNGSQLSSNVARRTAACSCLLHSTPMWRAPRHVLPASLFSNVECIKAWSASALYANVASTTPDVLSVRVLLLCSYPPPVWRAPRHAPACVVLNQCGMRHSMVLHALLYTNATYTKACPTCPCSAPVWHARRYT